mgnify:CR=1 FL=1
MIDFRTDILPLKNQLYRLALRITLDSAEAEDIVQETLIKVWNKRDDWERIDNIEAFCLTVCRNLSLDSVKRLHALPAGHRQRPARPRAPLRQPAPREAAQLHTAA